MPKTTPARPPAGRHPGSLPADVELLPWAAAQLGISSSTAYRLAAAGRIPGLFRVGAQYRISVARFLREVHGEAM
jgi:excisionase family DNA binding protein